MPLTTTLGFKKPDAASGDHRSDLYNAIRDNADLANTLISQLQPATVTALPTTGLFDGRLVYLQTTNMASAGIRWLMRYRLATTKWEFLGGAPWVAGAGVGGGEQRGPAANSGVVNGLTNPPLDSAGNNILLPAAGKYFVETELRIEPASADPQPRIRLYIVKTSAANVARMGPWYGPLTSYSGTLGESAGLVFRFSDRLFAWAAGDSPRIAFSIAMPGGAITSPNQILIDEPMIKVTPLQLG